MNKTGRMETGDFSTREQVSEPIYRRGRYNVYSNKKRSPTHKKASDNGCSRGSIMLIKIGICAGICAVFALLKLMNIPAVNRGLDVIGEALDQGQEYDDTLGKLKFVELPGILEVFAGGDDFIQPISFKSAYLDETQTILTLTGDRNGVVTVCDEGTVKTIGVDDELGNFISVIHSDDIETIYYGLETISVDEGQPMNRLDTLGRLSNNGILLLCVTEGGEPKNPCQYIGIDASDLDS